MNAARAVFGQEGSVAGSAVGFLDSCTLVLLVSDASLASVFFIACTLLSAKSASGAIRL